MQIKQLKTVLGFRAKVSSFLVALIVVVGGILGLTNGQIDQVIDIFDKIEPGYYKVTKIHDGDTITVDMNGHKETIRFIGIDTPETHHPSKPVQCFGKAATAFMIALLGDDDVRLEADPQNTNRDRYDRLLRYVYLPDGTLVNAKVVEEGYGFAYLSFPFSKLEEFKLLEDQARANNKGLWNSCDIEESKGYINTVPAEAAS